MITLRSLSYLLFMGITVILYAVPISLFRRIAPYGLIARAGKHWGKINLWALEKICGLTYRVRGWDNLPKRNCVVLCKHQSAWETIALRGLLPAEHTWVLKRELLRVPFFGWALAAFQPIAIDRSAGRKAVLQMLREGKYWLDQGRWIVVFPEGTRVSPGEHKTFNPGGAMLAKKSGYAVLPIAHNAGVFWRRRDLKKHPGTIDVVIGEPLDTAGLSVADVNQRVEQWIEDTVSSLPQHRS